MHETELLRMRDLIRKSQYVMTLHAEDEMEADGLSIFDVEHAILTGQVTERQRDRDTGEWKYLVTGEALEGAGVTVVAKFGPTGKMIVITVYRE